MSSFAARGAVLGGARLLDIVEYGRYRQFMATAMLMLLVALLSALIIAAGRQWIVPDEIAGSWLQLAVYVPPMKPVQSFPRE